MSGKIEKLCSNPHECDITAISYCNKTQLLYTAGGDAKIKVSVKLNQYIFFKLTFLF